MKPAICLLVLVFGGGFFCRTVPWPAGTTEKVDGRLVSAQSFGLADGKALWRGGIGREKRPSIVAYDGGNRMMHIPAIRNNGSNSQALLASLPKTAASLKPGVYRTAPYAGIVVVPGKHPDDRAMIYPEQAESKMPIIKPELRLIPIEASHK